MVSLRSVSGIAGVKDTYYVEADKAELRHYLGRLARQSR